MADAELPIARAGLEAAALRLRRYALAGSAAVRAGEGWIAVATGVLANDMNGIVSAPHASISGEIIDDLLAWFTTRGLPASWLVATDEPDLASALILRGARDETTGWWAGRAISPDVLEPSSPTGIVIRRVVADADLEDWLAVAEQCAWFDSDDDRALARALYRSVGLEDDSLAHWVAYRGARPVGMASSFISRNGVVDLCNLAVIELERQRGIGRALAYERIRFAHERGATTIVSALSPDGWRLYHTLGFVSVPVEPHHWFYLPTFHEEGRNERR